MPSGPFYAKRSSFFGQWELRKRTKTGDRQLAFGMSEKYARKVAKLLNEAEAE